MAEGAQSIRRAYLSARRPYVTLAILAVAWAIPLWSVLQNYRALDLASDQTASRWVERVMQELPEGALLITGEDQHTFTLDYVLWVEGRRQDLCVIDGELWQYPWYTQQVAKRCPAIAAGDSAESLADLIATNVEQRPVYLASARPELEANYEIGQQGAVWRIHARKGEPSEDSSPSSP